MASHASPFSHDPRAALHRSWCRPGRHQSARSGDTCPDFLTLRRFPGAASVLVEAAKQVLSSGIKVEHATLEQLVTLVLRHNATAIPALASDALAGNSASPEVVGIWSAAILLTAQPNDASALSTLSSPSAETLWAIIEVLKSGRLNHHQAPALSTVKRAQIVAVFGSRFPNTGHPIGETICGRQNPWDAAEFIGNQIKGIAGDNSPEADAHLATLENNPALSSYRDAIRHHRAQREKKVRENTFEPADPAAVAFALKQAAPANSARSSCLRRRASAASEPGNENHVPRTVSGLLEQE